MPVQSAEARSCDHITQDDVIKYEQEERERFRNKVRSLWLKYHYAHIRPTPESSGHFSHLPIRDFIALGHHILAALYLKL